MMSVLIQGEAGQLWGRKPASDKDGTIVTFARPSDSRIRLTCAAFAAHTSDIVVGDSDGCGWVIHLKANRFALLSNSGPPCSSVACHPSRNDEAVMGHSNGHLVVLNTRAKNEINLLRSHRTAVTGIVYSSSLEYIASISCDALIIWSAKV
jgi:WD40 repeat protein